MRSREDKGASRLSKRAAMRVDCFSFVKNSFRNVSSFIEH